MPDDMQIRRVCSEHTMAALARPRGDSLIARRTILLAMAGSLGLLVAPGFSHGQPKAKIPRIGILWFPSMDDPPLQKNRSAFLRRLSALGYVEGKNILLEERSAEGQPERLSELARELAAIKVDVIVAPTAAAARAARQATNSIPIVMVHAGDPIGAGLITSLARPGGNVTGTTNLTYAGKQVELMHELAPRAVNLAILLNPTNSGARAYILEAIEAGRRFNLRIGVAEVARAEDFPHAFALIRDMRADGLLVMGDPLIGDHRAEVFAFAASARLPAAYDPPNMARDGGLIAYGPLLVEHYVMAAGYVDRILKGAKPADLPVEQPTRFELIVNVKTAKSLDLTIPQSLIARADEIVR
jgi:putative ABC transport system substrate-binding protein